MALAVAHPFQPAQSGVYCFRKAVPEDLRPVLKRVEVPLRWLGTKDPAEAMLLRRFEEMAEALDRVCVTGGRFPIWLAALPTPTFP